MEKIHCEIKGFILKHSEVEININYTSFLAFKVLRSFKHYGAIDSDRLQQIKTTKNSIVEDRNIIILCTYEVQLLIEFDNDYNIVLKQLTILKPEQVEHKLFLCDNIIDGVRELTYIKPLDIPKYSINTAINHVYLSKLL